MGNVIVIEFVTMDGVVSDPDGSGGTSTGGWAFRFGPGSVAGDKFRLGPALDTGLMVLGRRTWELFSGIWPGRSDDFARKMNAIPKLVASRSRLDTSAWSNSRVIERELVDVVDDQRRRRDVIVTGSLSIVRALMDRDLVDEYRLLVFPSIVGGGERLFSAGSRPVDLTCLSVEQVGAAALLRYGRAA
jgi:dihydrofolate reductase